MLNEFYFSKYQFHIKCSSKIELPSYSGSTLRGGFGHAFKRIACPFKKKDCNDCLLVNQCIYAYVFESPLPADSEIMKNTSTIPQPFILEPPNVGKRIFEPGERIDFGLTLIGKAVNYLAYFVYAFDELGRIGLGRGRGKYELLEVCKRAVLQRDELARDQIVYDNESQKLSNLTNLSTWTELVNGNKPLSNGLTLFFKTPTRIKYQNHLTKKLEFHILVRNLLRRISMLSYFHCGYKIDVVDFKGLIDRAKSVRIQEESIYWDDWERYSNRQQQRLKLGGFCGSLVYKGDISDCWPFIKLGEVVHVGKGTAFGLGKYSINEEVA